MVSLVMVVHSLRTVIIGALFCFTLGGGMGANDVANNFGTSVGSRSVSLKQALVIAAIFELVGSVALGAAVTDSVRKNVYEDARVSTYISHTAHDSSEFLLIANLTVLITVTIWLFVASYARMSVSTTHSIIGAYMGCGLAISPHVVNWRYLLNVLASWFIAPAISLILAAIIFVCIRRFILRAEKPVIIADRFLPIFLLYVCAVICIFFTFSNPITFAHFKCRQQLKTDDNVTYTDTVAPCELGKYARAHVWQSILVALGTALLIATALYFPVKRWIKRRLVETQLKKFNDPIWDSMSMRHRSLSSMEIEGHVVEMEAPHSQVPRTRSEPLEIYYQSSSSGLSDIMPSDESLAGTPPPEEILAVEATPGCAMKLVLAAPWNRDLHAEAAQADGKVTEFEKMSERFDPKADAYFKALQVCSAALACLVHGSNDVGNAAAPFASIWTIYKEGKYVKSIDVPIWVLILGGSSISIGLMILGHKVIRTIGIELVHMNAPKGFSVEMALFTVIIVASFLGFTISSTHVGVAAMVGVGLMDRYIDSTTGADLTPNRFLNTKAVNWRIAMKLCLSWIGTLILCGTAAYLISSFAFRTPSLVETVHVVRSHDLRAFTFRAVVFGGIFCFTLGGGMGANDVANNFGTSVGSKSISLRNALIIAAIFELAGSVGLGSSVTDSVRKGVFYPSEFGEMADFLLIANVVSLLTVTIWLFTASSIRMSVSTTHSLIGSFMGCGLAMTPRAVNWSYLGTVLLSWIIAPSLSMIVGAILYVTVRGVILRAENPVDRARKALPVLILYVCCVISIYLTFDNPVVLSSKSCLQKIDGQLVDTSPCKVSKWVSAHMGPAWGIAWGAGITLSIILYWPINRWIQHSLKKAELEVEDRKLNEMLAANEEGNASKMITSDESVEDATDEENLGCKVRVNRALENAPWNKDLHAEVEEKNENVHELAMLTEKFDWRGEAYFRALQTVSAALACLVHGSNDVSNAAAPFASIYSIYKEGAFLPSVSVPIWVLVLAGSSISLGLMALGYKVIQTVGIELLHMSAPKGFCVEMSIFTIIISCSFLGFSISSTHIGVGAMIGVGLMDRHRDPETGEDITHKKLGYLNFKAINWKLAGKLAISWIGTIILCALLSYLLFSFAILSPTKVDRFIPCPGEVVNGICVR